MAVNGYLSSAQIRSGFEEMTKLDIIIAPWLVLSDGIERLNETQQNRIHRLAYELSVVYTTGHVLWWDTVAVPDFYRENVYYETLLSSAAYLSYMTLGTLVITDEMISVAHRLIEEYLKKGDGSVLLSIYARVMAYLNGQLLIYYGQVPEEVFVSGAWHRPWTERSLAEELKFLIKQGLVVRQNTNGRMWIHLTESGKGLYHASAADLRNCGYLKHREQLMRASRFTHMDDYEPIMERMNSKLHEQRKSLLEWSSIDDGMQVLELGCGAGALTLDDGLYHAVGPEGRITATDPSLGMLARAENKKQKYGAANVWFRQASAENIPFPDATFDAVIGMLFLHFTDIPRALHEVRRVIKPGGTFTTLYGLNFSGSQYFFTEWFEPLFKRGLASHEPNVLPEEDFVPSIAGQYFDKFEYKTEIFDIDLSDVEKSVRFLVGAGTMAELNELPWRARNELFDALIERGHYVKEKYGAHHMKLGQKGQWFRGTVRH
jgi:ubiquinone/menaquinone biosynthesis C-methylase UbiE